MHVDDKERFGQMVVDQSWFKDFSKMPWPVPIDLLSKPGYHQRHHLAFETVCKDLKTWRFETRLICSGFGFAWPLVFFNVSDLPSSFVSVAMLWREKLAMFVGILSWLVTLDQVWCHLSRRLHSFGLLCSEIRLCASLFAVSRALDPCESSFPQLFPSSPLGLCEVWSVLQR